VNGRWAVLWIALIFAAALPASEVAVRRLPLAGPAAARAAEFSGLAWHGDVLILLPQFPKGALMALDKPVLRAAVASAAPDALTPRALPFDDGGLPGLIPGFAGYEALVVSGGRVYLAVETEGFDCTMGAWIVMGRIDAAGAIVLELDSRVAVPLGAQRCNMSVEALTLHGGSLYAFEEANGRRVQATPRVHVYGLDLRPLRSIAGPLLEYRLTDATAADPDGVFWVSNYLWPGDSRQTRSSTGAGGHQARSGIAYAPAAGGAFGGDAGGSGSRGAHCAAARLAGAGSAGRAELGGHRPAGCDGLPAGE
jgi:hypothetical protein